MSATQRRKGASGERELLRLLAQDLGLPLARNLGQTRAGGADCLDLPGLALEVKRQERLNLPAWWQQAQAQARQSGRVPVLAWRQSRRPWRFRLPLPLLDPAAPPELVADLDYPAALHTFRNFLSKGN